MNSQFDNLSFRTSRVSKSIILAFLLIFVVLGYLAWKIEYPDIVRANSIVRAKNFPKQIISRQEGRITKLFRLNNEFVKEGEIIAYVESLASHDTILLLLDNLNSLNLNSNSNDSSKNVPIINFNVSQLGEISGEYEKFVNIYQEYLNCQPEGYYEKKIESIGQEILIIKKSIQLLYLQQELVEKDAFLSQETYSANRKLFEEKVISSGEIRNEESRLIGKKLSIPQVKNSILTLEAAHVQKNKEIADIKNLISKGKFLFLEATQKLISNILQWKQRFIINAPLSGYITFSSPLQEGVYIKQGQVVAQINPLNTSFFAELHLSQQNLTSVKIGQDVRIKVLAYPHYSFGTLAGKIDYISDVNTDSGFIAHVKLSNNFFRKGIVGLDFKDGLRGEALILTNRRRVIQILYHNIVDLSSQ